MNLKPSVNKNLHNRYRAVRLIGAGGMGEVYEVEDRLRFNHRVALKRVLVDDITFSSMGQDETRSKFEVAIAEEFRILASLRHPNIISVLDYGFDKQGNPFFTMDLLAKSQTLREACYEADTPVETILNYFIQILQALDYLHLRSIIHRDLKPNNIMIVNDVVKVLDFGLAVSTKAHDAQASDDIAGTLAYIAPEIFMGKAVSIQSDLYAVGLMLYECLTGQHPFLNQAEGAHIITAILYHDVDYQPIDNLPHHQAHKIHDVLMNLLHKTPEERYTTAYEAMLQLASIMQNPPQLTREIIRESYLQATDFVGREAEYDQLVRALDTVQQGHSQVWLVGGESGVGKSRLLEELRIKALVKHFTVARGRASSEHTAPYHLWREPLHHLLLDTDVPVNHLAILKMIDTDITSILDADVPDMMPLDAEEQQQRLHETILTLLKLNKPHLILLEDVQWASTESIAILKELMTTPIPHPLMIVASYREEDAQSHQLLDDLKPYHHIVLQRFDETQLRHLSQSMLGSHQLTPAFIQFLQKQTEGNVLFVIEVLLSLVEKFGHLHTIQLDELPQELHVEGIHVILQRRIDKMPAWAQPLLETAALFGKQLDTQLLAKIQGKTTDKNTQNTFEEWLRAGLNANIFEIQEDTWHFSHDKLRDIIIHTIKPEEVSTKHHLLAESLEELGQTEQKATVLAHHWQHARRPDKAFPYMVTAASQLADLALHTKSRSLLETAISIYDHEQLDMPAHYAHSLHLLGFAYHGLALHDDALIRYEQSIALYDKLNDFNKMATIYSLIGMLERLRGHFEDAKVACQKSINLARNSDDSAIIIAGNHITLGIISAMTGELEKARSNFEEAVHIARQYRQTHTSTLTNAVISLGIVSAMMGQVEQSRDLFQESLEIALEQGNQQNIAIAHINMGDACLALHDLTEAKQHYKKAITHAQDSGATPVTLAAIAAYAFCKAREGDVEQALIWAIFVQHHPRTDNDNIQKAKQFMDEYHEPITHINLEEITAIAKKITLDDVIIAIQTA